MRESPWSGRCDSGLGFTFTGSLVTPNTVPVAATRQAPIRVVVFATPTRILVKPTHGIRHLFHDGAPGVAASLAGCHDS
jgi:hypothetical protein